MLKFCKRCACGSKARSVAPVCDVYVVVGRSQVGACCDVVDVEVGVIVLSICAHTYLIRYQCIESHQRISHVQRTATMCLTVRDASKHTSLQQEPRPENGMMQYVYTSTFSQRLSRTPQIGSKLLWERTVCASFAACAQHVMFLS
jgi:hypothetical protein